MSSEKTPFYSVAELSEELDVAPQDLRTLVRSGAVDGRKLGSAWAITEDGRQDVIALTRDADEDAKAGADDADDDDDSDFDDDSNFDDDSDFDDLE